MTEKQELLLQLFREVDAICKKHNLRYVMAGGTLIGVLRNEGFIPWDDDVDIYMPKSDWDKFVEICKTEMPDNRAIYCSDVDRTSPNSFPRYGSTDTCSIHKHQIIGDDKAGEIIDVLTLDPIPDDDREYEKYRTYMMIYTDLINISMVVGARWEISAWKYLYWLFRYKFFGKDRTLKKLEKLMFSYKEEECSRYAMRWGGCPFLFDKDMMFPVKYMDFEGEKVMVPHRVSDYLIWHYGDEWSYIPPHGERESHESIYVPGANYQEIRDEYMPRISRGRIRRQMTFRKFYCLLMAKKDHKLDVERNRIRAEAAAKDLEARLLRSERSLETLLAEKRFDVLNEIFDNYYKIQLSAEFIGREDYNGIRPFYHPTLIRTEDGTFQAAMLTLIYTERVSKAYRMYEVRRKMDYITPEMEQTVEDIRAFRKAASLYEFHEKKEAEAIVDDLLKKYPDAPGFIKFKCRFVMERLEEVKDFSEAEKFLAYCLKHFPQDGYFIKYKGDLLWKKGLQNEAMEKYALARETTNNGIVHLELDKFLQDKKTQVISQCRKLLEARHKSEASVYMELWKKLLPEDTEIDGAFYLAKVSVVRTKAKLEELVKELYLKIGISGKIEKKPLSEEMLYREALTLAWKRFGYPEVLADCRTRFLCTDEVSDMEYLAEEVRSYLVHKQWQGETWKLLGDIRRKQGQTKEAFENYFKALEHMQHPYLKTELAGIFLRDLYNGSKRSAFFAKKSDVSEFLDVWLYKYKSQENIQELLKKIM